MADRIGKPISQRQLRVGEMIKQSLGMIFSRNEAKVPNLETNTITVTEVKMSQDLKIAKAYVLPLGGKDTEEDKALAKELLEDPKERAEHLMLLDLGRNDVGRVSKIGTVKVVEQFEIEYYSHVMHIASHVEGEISQEYDALDALAAGFPAGTVSGAPKIRAMEIIDEVETLKRNIYSGAIGNLSWHGGMDLAIAIRTAIIKDEVLYVQAGAGIVYDSIPEMEWQETMDKAQALIKAAQNI